MIRLTYKGLLLVTLSVLFYFASVTSQSSMLLLLIGVFLSLCVFNLIGARRAVDQVVLEAPPTAHLAEGGRFNLPWKVTNAGARPGGLLAVTSNAGPLFRAGLLAPDSTVSLVPELAGTRRGVHSYGAVTVASSYPFGLARARRRFSLPGEMVVHPAVYPAAAPRAAGFDAVVGGKFKGHRLTASGASFAGVRPMQPGDPFKQIHWKSSAKGRGLMVKTFEEELAGRVGLVLDTGHTGELEKFDDAARAAGSLMFAALDAGHHVEWIDLGELTPRLVPPSSDGQEVLERLARMPVTRDCLTAERLAAAVERLSRRNALHFVLTAITPAVEEIVDRLARERRLVTVYLPGGGELSVAGVELRRYTARAIEEAA